MVVIIFNSWENFERQCRSISHYYSVYFYYKRYSGRVDLHKFEYEFDYKIYRYCTTDYRYFPLYINLVKSLEPDQLPLIIEQAAYRLIN